MIRYAYSRANSQEVASCVRQRTTRVRGRPATDARGLRAYA